MAAVAGEAREGSEIDGAARGMRRNRLWCGGVPCRVLYNSCLFNYLILSICHT